MEGQVTVTGFDHDAFSRARNGQCASTMARQPRLRDDIQPLPVVKPPRHLVGLALGPICRGVSREIAGRSNEDVAGSNRSA